VGAAGEQQCQTKPTWNEGCMPSRMKTEASEPAQHAGAIHEGNHKSYTHVLLEKKWQ
jgi:hypothetical protein